MFSLYMLRGKPVKTRQANVMALPWLVPYVNQNEKLIMYERLEYNGMLNIRLVKASGF